MGEYAISLVENPEICIKLPNDKEFRSDLFAAQNAIETMESEVIAKEGTERDMLARIQAWVLEMSGEQITLSAASVLHRAVYYHFAQFKKKVATDYPLDIGTESAQKNLPLETFDS